MERNVLVDRLKGYACFLVLFGHVIRGIRTAGISVPQFFEGMELIRPLYLVREADICAWRDYNELHFLQCACHFTETCATCHEDGTTSSKRLETKRIIAELKKTNPYIETNIFNSVSNVHLDTVIEYKKDGVRHNFLDEY